MSMSGEGGPTMNVDDPAGASTNREYVGQSNNPDVEVEHINGDAYYFDKLDLGSITEAEIRKLRFVDNEVAFEFYRRYAKKRGFGVRRNQIRRGRNGDLLWQSFVCSSQGFRLEEHLGREDRKRSERKLTRCGCTTMFRVHIDKENGGWYVTGFNDNHNHETVNEVSSALLRCHRVMTAEDIIQMNCMREAGISIPKIFGMFACQSGGYPLIGFNKRDMYNEIAEQRKVGSGDAERAVKYLRDLARSDKSMFWKHTVDNEGKFQHLFWADGCSIFDYSVFGDVLAFDATYGRNKYKFPIVVFSGVNHHRQTTVFGTAIVSDESEETYVWVLEQFLEAMGGKTPKCVITDGDFSMANAIRRVFPEAHHRLCGWHLLQNATRNLHSKKFTSDFRYCMCADMEIDEFEERWEKLKYDNGVQDNEWVGDLYDIKEKWATAYIRGEFYAGLTTTSRCEGLHAQVGRYVESGYSLSEFIHHFQRCLSYIRWVEVCADHNSQVGEPVLKTQLAELERFGASVYTHEIFKLFQLVLKSAETKFVLGWRELNSQVIYLVTRYRKPECRWQVSYAPKEGIMKCSCKRMESSGIPCCHIVKVAVFLHMGELSSYLVSKRWTKKAKAHSVTRNQLGAAFGDDTLFSSRYGALSDICRRWCNLAARSEADFKELRQKALIDCERLEAKHRAEDEDGDAPQFHGEDANIRDPIRVRTKGRVKHCVSRPRTVKRPFKCSSCRGEGHSKNHCPYMEQLQNSSNFGSKEPFDFGSQTGMNG